MRIPLEIIGIDELLSNIEFKVFAEPAKNPNSRVGAMKILSPKSASMTDLNSPRVISSIICIISFSFINEVSTSSWVNSG
jgi:aspartyl-tRNA synthetase